MIKATRSPSSVKDILEAAQILLQPPATLPTDSSELRARLNDSWRALPHSWDDGLAALARQISGSDQPDTEEEEDLDQLIAGVEALSTENQGDQKLFGLRCLDILVGLQAVLEKEFWPAESRGHDAKDFVLGTSDIRLIRTLITCSLELLSSLSLDYLNLLQSSPSPSSGDISENPPLKPVISAFLSLLRPSSSPFPSAGPSTPTYLPPTTITQHLYTTSMAPILLSSILLGYTPSIPPPIHLDIRRSSLSILNTLSPAVALLALTGVLSSISPTKKPLLASISNHPDIIYPDYIAQIVNKQLSAQILRPSGPLALLLNLFGERALSNAESVDDKKVNHAIQLLRRIPTGMDEEVYMRHVTRECLDILAPPKVGKEGTKVKDAPRAFRSVAAGVIGVWLRKEVVKGVLSETFTDIELEGDIAGQREEERLRGLILLDTLTGYTDPAHLPKLLERVVRPLLTSLEGLASRISSGDAGVASVESSAENRGSEEVSRGVAELTGDILEVWRNIMSSRPSIGE